MSSSRRASVESLPDRIDEDGLPLLDLRDTEILTEIKMAKVGVSLVSEKLTEELLFSELSQFTFRTHSKADSQDIRLTISDIQIDSQLVSVTMSVCLYVCTSVCLYVCLYAD